MVLAGASDLATDRQSWKDDPGLGDVVTSTTRATTATSS
jgi:hypothetical protein